jgi:hypothetical protein
MKLAIVFSASLVAISAVAAIADNAPPTAGNLAALKQIADQSKCIAHSWKFRGLAPKTYIEGVATVFARAVCHPERSDVGVVSAAPDAKAHPNDGLVAYSDIFAANGMHNDAAGVDTLRHSYVLLIGLGMMESSGKYCEGRDVSECFDSGDTAEAGLFQTSFGAHVHSASLDALFTAYKADQNGCMLDVFKDSLTCRIHKSQNPKCPNATSEPVGDPPGLDWQRLTKACPAFSTEYGAVVLRVNGGAHGEFGPIRKRQAEVLPACDDMLKNVQSVVVAHPDMCTGL